MAQVLRKRFRALLLAAKSVALALDDRGPYRVIRFRCDCVVDGLSGSKSPLESTVEFGVTSPGSDFSSSVGGKSPESYVGWFDGLLGLYSQTAEALEKDNLEDLDRDYSDRMRDSVIDAMKQLFTVDNIVDEAAVAKVFSKVHTYVSDGAGPSNA